MVKLLLVGHRGVGKSSLLKNLKANFSNENILFLSLDEFIEEKAACKISELFKERGEPGFRQIEEECLLDLVTSNEKYSVVIDVGAGFAGKKPDSFKTLWVKRKIDSSQSQFLNRPSLDGELKISKERFEQRQSYYQDISDVQMELREGKSTFAAGERLFFENLLLNSKPSKSLENWSYTLKEDSSETQISLLKNMGLKQFELRDDLLSEEKIQSHLTSLPFLMSYRKNKEILSADHKTWDWPIEWGQNSEAPTLSLHKRKESVEETIKHFPETSQMLKLAIPINNFSELKVCHEWYLKDQKKRCFLPMSDGGRWFWYRLLMAQKMPLQFLRLGEGTAADQPSLLEVLNFKSEFINFAAILGAPVRHSYTPTFHQDYFTKKKANVLAIEIYEEEFDEALPFLQTLGLRWAAVTSPLKQKAAELSESLNAVNTLFYDGAKWSFANTDEFGLAQLVGDKKEGVAVWGGGGVHKSIENLIPQATFYSSRTGELKKGPKAAKPETLIWAVGNESFSKEGIFPPADWPLKSILDLNYTQDSPGIECVHKFSCQYQSGLGMFVAQAKKQQEFWNECELK